MTGLTTTHTLLLDQSNLLFSDLRSRRPPALSSSSFVQAIQKIIALFREFLGMPQTKKYQQKMLEQIATTGSKYLEEVKTQARYSDSTAEATKEMYRLTTLLMIVKEAIPTYLNPTSITRLAQETRLTLLAAPLLHRNNSYGLPSWESALHSSSLSSPQEDAPLLTSFPPIFYHSNELHSLCNELLQTFDVDQKQVVVNIGAFKWLNIQLKHATVGQNDEPLLSQAQSILDLLTSWITTNIWP